MKTGQPKVAVIGCTIAGLACAMALRQAGCGVTVYDVAHGGAEKDGNDGNTPFTASDPAFRAEVQTWINAGVAALWPAPASAPVADERFVGIPDRGGPLRHMAVVLHVVPQATVLPLGAALPGGGWPLQGLGPADAPVFDTVLLAVAPAQAGAWLAVAAPALAAAAQATQGEHAEQAEQAAPDGLWHAALQLGVCGAADEPQSEWLRGRALAQQVLAA